MENTQTTLELIQVVNTCIQAVERDRQDAWGYCNLGVALGQMEWWDHAVIALQEAIRIVPDFSRAHRGLGAIYRQTGRISEAAFHHGVASRLEKEAVQAAEQRRQIMGEVLMRIYPEEAN